MNARQKLDVALLDMVLAEGRLEQRVLFGVVQLVSIQAEEVPAHRQATFDLLREQAQQMIRASRAEAHAFVMQLVQFRNLLLQEEEQVRSRETFS